VCRALIRGVCLLSFILLMLRYYELFCCDVLKKIKYACFELIEVACKFFIWLYHYVFYRFKAFRMLHILLCTLCLLRGPNYVMLCHVMYLLEVYMYSDRLNIMCTSHCNIMALCEICIC